jgi:hypothetical protein
MSDMTPEKAQALLDGATPGAPWVVLDRDLIPDLARAYIAQAVQLEAAQALLAGAEEMRVSNMTRIDAELTRLRARIEAADKLAELGWRAKHGFHVNNDELAAALSAYEGVEK